ncbi:MAG: hypothetical protein WC222_02850 [Parachlamydiales bacterium]|jgi:hypothetical protein
MELFQQAGQVLKSEWQSIQTNYENCVANYNNSRFYEKGPLILLEIGLFTLSPSSYIIGKAVAICTAQWASSTIEKIHQKIPPSFNALSNTAKNLSYIGLAGLTIVVFPKHLLLKLASFATGVYYFQRPKEVPTVSLLRLPAQQTSFGGSRLF